MNTCTCLQKHKNYNTEEGTRDKEGRLRKKEAGEGNSS